MLPFIFACLIVFIIIMYVILDGFDLGIGILFPFTENEADRDQMMNSVAPVWDGNETWLVFGGAMLYGAFPRVYGSLLPMLYIPLMIMLIALIFRGVCFEFRFKADKSKIIWNWLFAISSIAASFFQGIILGCLIEGFPLPKAGELFSKPWLSPFSLFTGFSLVCGYALLGSTWMLMKSEGRLQKKMIDSAKGLLIIVSFCLIIVSIWTPFQSHPIYNRWFSFTHALLFSPFPLIACLMVILIWKQLNKGHESKPFIYSIGLFLSAYFGIGLSLYPYLIPYEVSIWDAAAPDSTLRFILIGVAIALPVLLGYTFYAYYLFRGKSHQGYH